MSNSTTSDEKIKQINLKGHKGPVISLAHTSEIRKIKKNRQNNSDDETQQRSCCLLSGSEDGTARLWDLKSSSRASLCIVAPSSSDSLTDGREVTAVSFHPILGSGGGSDEGNPSYPFTVYIAVGSNVYGYDLRNTSTPIVRRYDTHVNSLEGGEEINQIAFSNNNKVYLAVGDDDGRIRITDSLNNKNNRNNNCRTLTHGLDEESSATLVTTVAFRPRGLDLASGGTDCTVCLWDITRPRRPSSSFHIEVDTSDTAGKDGRGGVNQVCNPPIVHSLSWSPSGRLLAAGLGDGSSILFKVEGRRMTEVGRLKGGHDAAVASVLFPKFGGVSHLSSHVAAEDRLLVTAGNDGAILLWDLGTQIVGGGGAVDPARMFVGCSGENDEGAEANTHDNMNNNIEDVPEDLAKLSLSSKDEEYKVLFGIPHGKKPNWVVSSAATEQVMPSSLFVADTSNDITGYILPR